MTSKLERDKLKGKEGKDTNQDPLKWKEKSMNFRTDNKNASAKDSKNLWKQKCITTSWNETQ